MEKNNNKKKTTKYGEVIPTKFAWVGLERQKRIANKLANIGKEKSKKD